METRNEVIFSVIEEKEVVTRIRARRAFKIDVLLHANCRFAARYMDHETVYTTEDGTHFERNFFANRCGNLPRYDNHSG